MISDQVIFTSFHFYVNSLFPTKWKRKRKFFLEFQADKIRRKDYTINNDDTDQFNFLIFMRKVNCPLSYFSFKKVC